MSPRGADSQETEAKIKEAARQVFLRDGYAGARMRDIASEAGINLALINYYFRSKEQLFLAIYAETLMQFMGHIGQVLNRDNSLEEKIYELTDSYTTLMIANPLAPQFILSEAAAGSQFLTQTLGIKERVLSSKFVEQLQSEAAAGRIRAIHPMHFIVTLMGSIVFPVIGKPLFANVFNMPEEAYTAFLLERKQLVPAIMLAYLKS